MYGIAIRDLFIAVPNGVGAGLGVVYCALICAFPRRNHKWVAQGGQGVPAEGARGQGLVP